MSRLGLLVLVLALGCAPSRAADRLQDVLAAMQKAGERLKTLSSSFEQTNHDHILDEDEKSTGKLYLKAPGQIRWEYDPPHAKVLLVKDDKIVVYNPVAQQAQEFKKGQMPGAGADLLIGFGKSNAEIGKHYDVNLLEEDANQAVLELIPKPGSTASVFAAIELTINKKTWTPDRTVFHEMNRDTTLLIFQEVRVNGSLPARIFELDLPPNVDVIRGE